MAKVLGLPKLSPTMEEGVLVRWIKQEGERVEIDDVIAEIETDKAMMEFRAFDAGVLLKHLVPEGASLKPDEPMAVLGAKGESMEVALSSVTRVTQVAEPSREARVVPMSRTAEPVTTSDARERVPASPHVRRVARERGIDLRTLVGSGPHGRVVMRDMAHEPAFALRAGAPDSVTREPGAEVRPEPSLLALAAAPVQEGTLLPLTSMRKTIAQRLSASKREIPHFYLTVEVDAEPVERLRQQVNSALLADEKTSLNDFVLKACAVALRRVPACNASFEGDGIRTFSRVHLSVAMSVPDGLVTPVVRDADRRSLGDIAREVKSLAARARDKKLRPEDMAGGTFSVSNLGMFGVREFAAVIRPPEAAILAVGAVQDVPVVREGRVVAGRSMSLTLSCDHRVIDGVLGALLLKQIRTLVEQPLALLAL